VSETPTVAAVALPPGAANAGSAIGVWGNPGDGATLDRRPGTTAGVR
jgi:hypothetical protein